MPSSGHCISLVTLTVPLPSPCLLLIEPFRDGLWGSGEWSHLRCIESDIGCRELTGVMGKQPQSSFKFSHWRCLCSLTLAYHCGMFIISSQCIQSLSPAPTQGQQWVLSRQSSDHIYVIYTYVSMYAYSHAYVYEQNLINLCFINLLVHMHVYNTYVCMGFCIHIYPGAHTQMPGGCQLSCSIIFLLFS